MSDSLADPMDVQPELTLSMDSQAIMEQLLYPPQGIFKTQGIQLTSLALIVSGFLP